MSSMGRRVAQATDTSMNVNGNAAGVTGAVLDAATVDRATAPWSTGGKALGSTGQNIAGVSSALGLITGAYGMGKAGADMAQNGVNIQNGADMAFNAAGTTAGAIGLSGATGAASTVAAPLLGAAAAGYGVGGVINSIADSEYAVDENGQGTDDRLQQQVIDEAIARGEDPTSLANIAKGTLYGTAGQIWDAGRAATNWVGSFF